MFYAMKSFRKIMPAYSSKDTFLIKEFVFSLDLQEGLREMQEGLPSLQ